MSDLDERAAARVPSRGRGWRDDWPVAVLAAVAATVVWVVVTRIGSVDLLVRSGSGTQTVGVASVVVASLVVAMAGAGLLRLLERTTAGGRTVWTWCAVGVLVVSLAGPAGAESWSAAGCLALLHLVVGATVIVGLRVRHADRVA